MLQVGRETTATRERYLVWIVFKGIRSAATMNPSNVHANRDGQVGVAL